MFQAVRGLLCTEPPDTDIRSQIAETFFFPIEDVRTHAEIRQGVLVFGVAIGGIDRKGDNDVVLVCRFAALARLITCTACFKISSEALYIGKTGQFLAVAQMEIAVSLGGKERIIGLGKGFQIFPLLFT